MLSSILKIKLLNIIVPKAKLGRIKIGEEDRICIDFANYLRQLTLEKDFPYIWFHVPNQIGSYKPIHGLKQGWMGRHPGVPDFCFMGKDNFFIEFKAPKGKLSEGQKIFQEWCEHVKVPYYVCRSFEEGKHVIDQKI